MERNRFYTSREREREKRRKEMRRGKERWTHGDDKRLAHALLDVFANQGEIVVLSDNCSLWKSVQQRYQALAAAEQAILPGFTVAGRSARSLHTRWARSIRPDMVLFASIVDKLQKTGKKPAKAIKEAVKLFREERSEINAVAVRQYVMGRMRPPSPTGDSETDSTRPKLKFESFHFHHCYDVLRSNPRFIETLLEQCRVNGEGGARKRRRVDGIGALEEPEYSSSTSSDESDTADSNEDEELLLQSSSRFQPAKVGVISSEQVSTLRYPQPLSWKSSQATGNGVQRPSPQVRPLVQSSSTSQSRSDSVIVTIEDTRDDLELPRIECDREVANEYIRLRTQTLQEDRRLKLLAELRGVVTTISQLAQQLAWNGVASAALAARTGTTCPQLDQDILRDIAFFRGEKQRLMETIAGLDDDAVTQLRLIDVHFHSFTAHFTLSIMAARTLTLLPLVGVAAWSCNATLTRMSHQVRAPPGGEALDFIPGSMDDTIMETLETGDLVFFQRKLTALQPLAALHTWITRQQLRPRFDHCGWIYVDRLGRKFIVEETLDKVQCRPYSARLLTSEATEISVLTLKMERSKEMQEAANAFIAENVGRTSRISLRHTVSALISPEEMRKAKSDATPSFPCAAFVAEAYDAMGLVNKSQLTKNQPPLSSATVTPRDLAATRIKLQVPPEKQPDGAKSPAFGRLLPIRLE
ncbi:hypothetical protein P3T76_012633 [Phytophthora citrophthora]|uniref:Uncharacterized protein n=1 Tax=Phytophthora citrophthora TaxID=4793 RepID=A0AAD9LCS4_9STRA|nr:hypothetical protein P3T76_016411 [Phytophthora citrophthora]KAK1931701.1 hypothetical protein P3T76_012633 [Phytophthora citrophthora]